MTKIWKYELEISEAAQGLDLPDEGRIISVEAQGSRVCLWVLFVLGADKFLKRRYFSVHGTGEKASGEYIGTAHNLNPYIWHVFERSVPEATK